MASDLKLQRIVSQSTKVLRASACHDPGLNPARTLSQSIGAPKRVVAFQQKRNYLASVCWSPEDAGRCRIRLSLSPTGAFWPSSEGGTYSGLAVDGPTDPVEAIGADPDWCCRGSKLRPVVAAVVA